MLFFSRRTYERACDTLDSAVVELNIVLRRRILSLLSLHYLKRESHSLSVLYPCPSNILKAFTSLPIPILPLKVNGLEPVTVF